MVKTAQANKLDWRGQELYYGTRWVGSVVHVGNNQWSIIGVDGKLISGWSGNITWAKENGAIIIARQLNAEALGINPAAPAHPPDAPHPAPMPVQTTAQRNRARKR